MRDLIVHCPVLKNLAKHIACTSHKERKTKLVPKKYIIFNLNFKRSNILI